MRARTVLPLPLGGSFRYYEQGVAREGAVRIAPAAARGQRTRRLACDDARI